MADRTYPSYQDDFQSHSAHQRDYGDDRYAQDAYAQDAYAQDSYAPQDWPAGPYAQPADIEQDYYAPPAFAARAPQNPAPQGYAPEQPQPMFAQRGYGRPAARAEPAQAVRAEYRPNPPQNDFALRMPHAPMARVIHWAGAFCSAAFVFGAVYWAYDLAVRDVQGIPVVRAAAGPLRIAPEVPGGEISANQGLAVNAIAALGAAEPLPDAVTLAPQADDLTVDDISPSAPEAAPLGALTDLANAVPEEMPLSDEAAVEAALAMALQEGGEVPAGDAPDQSVELVPADTPPEPVTMSNTDPVLVEDAAIDPQIDPTAIDPQVAALSEPTAPPTAEVDPSTIQVGTKMVQLGAFDDDAGARAEWALLQTRFADLIGTKALVVQQAKSGGRNFYRLRAHGFADEDETRRFCAALLAENASCIPVAQR